LDSLNTGFNPLAGRSCYELRVGICRGVRQQIGVTDQLRLVCDIELDAGGYLNDVPFSGGTVDHKTGFPHGVFVQPRIGSTMAIQFIRGGYDSPIGCFLVPQPNWRDTINPTPDAAAGISLESDYDSLLDDPDDLTVCHFSGTYLNLKKDGTIELGKQTGDPRLVSFDSALTITFVQTPPLVGPVTGIKIDTPTGIPLTLGDNLVAALLNNLPMCIYSGAPHTLGNTKVKA
jgi:hypothetical protein